MPEMRKGPEQVGSILAREGAPAVAFDAQPSAAFNVRSCANSLPIVK